LIRRAQGKGPDDVIWSEVMSEELKSDVLRVVEAKRAVYYLTADYEEADIGHAVGTVFKTSGARDEEDAPEMVLSSNDTLSGLWLSPDGSLWVSSATGKVATTASVPWDAAGSGDGVGYSEEDGGLSWAVKALPPVKSTGLPPNITALWGIDDENVFVGTHGGHIYQWNGKDWRQTHEGPGRGDGTLGAFGGPAANDVFAAGRQGTLLHFDGAGWQAVLVPGESNGRETFTAVQVLPTDEVLISSAGSQGRLLHGGAQGLTEFGRYEVPLIGMALLDDRVLFATGDGCAELVGRDVKVIKDTFQTVNVFPGRDRVFYVEAEQEYPGYVEYVPAEDEAPWWRMAF
jgi:hypothetical protein